MLTNEERAADARRRIVDAVTALEAEGVGLTVRAVAERARASHRLVGAALRQRASGGVQRSESATDLMPVTCRCGARLGRIVPGAVVRCPRCGRPMRVPACHGTGPGACPRCGFPANRPTGVRGVCIACGHVGVAASRRSAVG